eukprot:3962724-Ditylum_brightwellii.AAC.1
MEDWGERNNGTWCASNGSRGGVILPERECADRRRHQNRNVLSMCLLLVQGKRRMIWKCSTKIMRMNMLQESH